MDCHALYLHFRHRNKPVEPISITELPEQTKRVVRVQADDDACVICCGDLDKKTKKDLFKLEECGHSFHTKCLFRWQRENNSCPLCRKELPKIPNSVDPEWVEDLN